jgi:hypothetical protein
VKNEFLAVEDIPNIDDGKLRYDIFVKSYIETREQGGINDLTPSEMFLQRINYIHSTHDNKQQSVTHVGNQKCNPSVGVQHLVYRNIVELTSFYETTRI